MSTDDPSQAATERAAAHLLHFTFMRIRHLASAREEQPSIETLTRRRDKIHDLADICHALPLLLGPERRDVLIDGLQHLWRTSSEHRKHWIRSCWDNIGYDYGWFEDCGSDSDTRRPASGG
ncbi:hypothetical protein ACFY2Q_09640 [Micromonospora sp. NPDC000316]|uniref:hypothetical protein n=1 Tax=Micromonospora sp. NPDC000316 TaxID=3364216 RepID=UPI0036878348